MVVIMLHTLQYQMSSNTELQTRITGEKLTIFVVAGFT